MVEEISQEILDILTCPVCKGKLIYVADKKHVECTNCKMNYPVEDGIPVILPPK